MEETSQTAERVNGQAGDVQELPRLLKVKTADEIDMEKYHENENTENPYFRKYGVKKQSCFSQARSDVFESEEDAQSPREGKPTSNHEVDVRPRPSCDLGSSLVGDEAHASPL